MALGRPTSYKPEYVEQVKKIAKYGLTNPELADYFDVDVFTIKEWRKKYPEFSTAIKEGKDISDAKVVKSLYKRANGYKVTEVTTEGNNVKKKVIKHIAPDVTAQIFWLKNRRPDEWREKSEQEVKHIGDLNISLTREIIGSKDKGNKD